MHAPGRQRGPEPTNAPNHRQPPDLRPGLNRHLAPGRPNALHRQHRPHVQHQADAHRGRNPHLARDGARPSRRCQRDGPGGLRIPVRRSPRRGSSRRTTNRPGAGRPPPPATFPPTLDHRRLAAAHGSRRLPLSFSPPGSHHRRLHLGDRLPGHLRLGACPRRERRSRSAPLPTIRRNGQHQIPFPTSPQRPAHPAWLRPQRVAPSGYRRNPFRPGPRPRPRPPHPLTDPRRPADPHPPTSGQHRIPFPTGLPPLLGEAGHRPQRTPQLDHRPTPARTDPAPQAVQDGHPRRQSPRPGHRRSRFQADVPPLPSQADPRRPATTDALYPIRSPPAPKSLPPQAARPPYRTRRPGYRQTPGPIGPQRLHPQTAPRRRPMTIASRGIRTAPRSRHPRTGRSRSRTRNRPRRTRCRTDLQLPPRLPCRHSWRTYPSCHPSRSPADRPRSSDVP